MLQTLLLLWRHPLADRVRHPSPASNSINMSLWVQLISNKCWQLTNGKCASYLHTASTFARQFSHSQQSSSADFSGQYCGHCPEMVLFKRILLSQDIDRHIHHDWIASHASAWVVRNRCPWPKDRSRPFGVKCPGWWICDILVDVSWKRGDGKQSSWKNSAEFQACSWSVRTKCIVSMQSDVEPGGGGNVSA